MLELRVAHSKGGMIWAALCVESAACYAVYQGTTDNPDSQKLIWLGDKKSAIEKFNEVADAFSLIDVEEPHGTFNDSPLTESFI
jgi:hypothetical protein